MGWAGLEEFQGFGRTKQLAFERGAGGGVVGGEGKGIKNKVVRLATSSLSLIMQEHAIAFTIVFTVTTSPAKIPAPESM